MLRDTNMAVYIVTYDLNKELHRPKIVEAIKTYGSWAKLSESSYAIQTNLTPEQVYNHLKPMIDGNDNIYIISLRHPWTGFGKKDVNEWLANRLPRT
jgi:GH43 family beta-xylosidase